MLKIRKTAGPGGIYGAVEQGARNFLLGSALNEFDLLSHALR
jgi:hypothetical protein